MIRKFLYIFAFYILILPSIHADSIVGSGTGSKSGSGIIDGGTIHHDDQIMFMLAESGARFQSEAGEPFLAQNGTAEQAEVDAHEDIPQSLADVHDTIPTDAQLDAAFGTPPTLGRGYIRTIDDADGNTNFYIVITIDISWYWLKMTKAL